MKNRQNGSGPLSRVAIRSPRGIGEPHDIAPRGSQHLSQFQYAPSRGTVKLGTQRSEALAAAHSLPLRLEELRDVLAFAQCGSVPGCPTVLEIRLIVRRAEDLAGHTGRPPEQRLPLPVSRLPFSPPSHTHFPHMTPRAPGPACVATAPAATASCSRPGGPLRPRRGRPPIPRRPGRSRRGRWGTTTSLRTGARRGPRSPAA